MTTIRSLLLVLATLCCFGGEAHAIYDAGTGRWLQRDPIKYIDGMSLYQYVRSNPGRYTDPMGLQPSRQRPPWETMNNLQNIHDNVSPTGDPWNMDDFVDHYYNKRNLFTNNVNGPMDLPGAPVNLEEVGRDEWYKNKPAVKRRMGECREMAEKLRKEMNDDDCHGDHGRYEDLDPSKTGIKTKDFVDSNVGFVIGGHQLSCTVKCNKVAGETTCEIEYQMRDRFEDPLDIGNNFKRDFEPGGDPYDIRYDWTEGYP